MSLHLLTSLAHDANAIAVASAALLLALAYLKRRQQLPFPPGPKPLLIMGNAHQLPKNDEHLTYTEWGKQYGEIVHVSVFSSHIILLNSHQAINDLLEKRSAIYSDRPILTMAGEIVGWNRALNLTPYGPRYKKFRKLVQGTLSARAAERYYPMQEQLVLGMLDSILEQPKEYVSWILRFSGSVIIKIAYGLDTQPHDDPIVRRAKQVATDFQQAGIPGAFLVDSIPMLKHLPRWFPGAGFKKKAEKWRANTDELAYIPHQMVKDQIAAGTAKPCFTTDLMDPPDGPKPDAEEEEIIIWSAATLYGAGAETNVQAVVTFLLAMILYPDVQKRAREELDSVTGRSRLPTFGDRPSMPYFEAVLKEVLRWHPATNLANPHRVMQEDEYKGYRIPSGATIVPNVWALSRDESVYPSPDVFDPTRHLPKDDGSPLPTDPRTYAFGFGRRVCPGQAIAWNVLYIAAISILASFEILPPVNEQGQVVLPKEEYISGIVSHPVPFECVFKPRSDVAVDLIKQAIAASKA